MAKSNLWRNLIVVGPPLVMVLLGVGIYIYVTQLLTPEVKTISALPVEDNQATASSTPAATASATPASVNPIDTQVARPTTAEIVEMQKEVDGGKEVWRLDPVETAEREAGKYGFIPGDQLNLSLPSGQTVATSPASVIATHGTELYVLTLEQLATKGPKGIWVLTAIEKQP